MIKINGKEYGDGLVYQDGNGIFFSVCRIKIGLQNPDGTENLIQMVDKKELEKTISEKEKTILLYDRCIATNTCPECGKDLDYTVFGSDGLRYLHCSHCKWDGGMISWKGTQRQ